MLTDFCIVMWMSLKAGIKTSCKAIQLHSWMLFYICIIQHIHAMSVTAEFDSFASNLDCSLHTDTERSFLCFMVTGRHQYLLNLCSEKAIFLRHLHPEFTTLSSYAILEPVSNIKTMLIVGS